MENREGATPQVGPAGGPRACPLPPTPEGPPRRSRVTDTRNKREPQLRGSDRTDPTGFKCGSKEIMSGKPPVQACPRLALNKRGS